MEKVRVTREMPFAAIGEEFEVNDQYIDFGNGWSCSGGLAIQNNIGFGWLERVEEEKGMCMCNHSTKPGSVIMVDDPTQSPLVCSKCHEALPFSIFQSKAEEKKGCCYCYGTGIMKETKLPCGCKKEKSLEEIFEKHLHGTIKESYQMTPSFWTMKKSPEELAQIARDHIVKVFDNLSEKYDYPDEDSGSGNEIFMHKHIREALLEIK